MSYIKKLKRKIIDKYYFWDPFLTKHLNYKNVDRDKFIDKYFPECPSRKKIRHDMRRNLFKYGCSYDEYFLYGIKDKKTGAKDFVTQLEICRYFNKLNKRKNQIEFDEKDRTYTIFKKYYKRELKKILNKEDFISWCINHSEFIAKPFAASFGEGIQIIRNIKTRKDMDNAWHKLEAILPFVVEELLEQDEVMSSLNPSSVNTVRISTVLTGNEKKGYKVYFLETMLKVGRNGSVIDNFGSGGFLSLIDENGVVYTDGFDKTGKSLKKHPDTGVIFKDFKLPEWDLALKICEEAALLYKKNRYIGFDLAYTKHNGWVMVEANARGEIKGTQIITKQGIKKKLDLLCSKI